MWTVLDYMKFPRMSAEPLVYPLAIYSYSPIEIFLGIIFVHIYISLQSSADFNYLATFSLYYCLFSPFKLIDTSPGCLNLFSKA